MLLSRALDVGVCVVEFVWWDEWEEVEGKCSKWIGVAGMGVGGRWWMEAGCGGEWAVMEGDGRGDGRQRPVFI